MRVDKCVVYTCICISRLIVDVIDIDTGKSICMCLMGLTHFFVSKFLRRGGGGATRRNKCVSASRQACSATRGRARLEEKEEAQATSSTRDEKRGR